MPGSEHLMQKKFGSEYGFSVKNGLIQGLMLMLVPVIAVNYAGIIGMGYFSAAYLVYLAVMMFTGLLVPYCTSRVAGNLAKKGRMKECLRFGTVGMAAAILAGVLFGCGLFLAAETIAGGMFLANASAVSLKMLSLSVVLLPLIGVLRGMLQGLGGTSVVFCSGVVELAGNVIACSCLSHYFYEEGVKMDVMKGDDIYRYAYSSGGAALGLFVGTVLAAIVLVFFYITLTKNLKGKGRNTQVKKKKDAFLVSVGLMFPLAISGAACVAVPLLGQSIVGNYLRRNVMESTYISEWGIFIGCYLALVLLPVMLSVAMGMMTVPLVRKEVTNETRIGLVYAVRLSIRLTMMCGIPASFGMLFLSYPMLTTFFPGMEDVSAPMVFLLSGFPLILLLSLAGITSVILVGMNRSYTLSFHVVFSFAGFMACCQFLMRAAGMGIYGALFGFLVFAILLSTANVLTIDRGLGTKQEWKKSYVFPLLASLLAGAGAVAGEYAVMQVLPDVTAFLTGLVIYMFLLYVMYALMKMLEEAEVYELPEGRKLYKKLKKIYFVR